jgi:hypothetical protein
MRTYEVEVIAYHAFLIEAEDEETARDIACDKADCNSSVYQVEVLNCELYEDDEEELWSNGLIPYTPYVKPTPVAAQQPTGYTPYRPQQSSQGYRYYAR